MHVSALQGRIFGPMLKLSRRLRIFAWFHLFLEIRRRGVVRFKSGSRVSNLEARILEITVVLEPDEDGGYTVIVPALPGCVSQGDTEEEALANIREAICAYIEALEMDFTLKPGSVVRKIRP